MKIRNMQYRGHTSSGVEYVWGRYSDDFYRNRVRHMYRFARLNGLGPSTARHLISECLWFGAQSKEHHNIDAVAL